MTRNVLGSEDERLILRDEQLMEEALALARQARDAGEVPVGAIVVRDGEIVGRGANAVIGRSDPTAHAELLAIREAAATIQNYRLEGCEVYSTLEPCAMCAGALVHARVRRLVFGARDLRFGAVRSKFALANSDLLNHQIEIEEGVRGFECAELLQLFFAGRR